MTRHDSYAELAEVYPFRTRPRRVPSPDCYHLAVQLPHGHLEPWWGDRGPVSLDVATRALEALMSDPPEDRDGRLCVVSVPGKWHDAEVAVTAEEVLARAPRVARCPGCGSQGHDLCGGDHCENGDRA